MTVTDFDDDGVDELFTADKYVAPTEEGGEALPAKGRVYAYRDGAIQEIFSADADNSITSYSAVTFGRLYPELSGIVLDGVKADGSMTTQIFVIDPVRGRLVNLPSGVNSETYQNPFSRPAAAPISLKGHQRGRRCGDSRHNASAWDSRLCHSGFHQFSGGLERL